MRSSLHSTARSPTSNRLHQTRPRRLRECSSLAPDCNAACITAWTAYSLPEESLSREVSSMLMSILEAGYLPSWL